VLLTFGAILTWVERKQAAIMSDRIGANRAYLRIPFTQVKLVWLGLFHGMADGLKLLLKEDFKPVTYDKLGYALALARVHAGGAGVRGDPVRRPADPGRCSPASPTGSAAAPTRCRSHRSTPACWWCSPSAASPSSRDARRLVVVEQVLDARRPARGSQLISYELVMGLTILA